MSILTVSTFIGKFLWTEAGAFLFNTEVYMPAKKKDSPVYGRRDPHGNQYRNEETRQLNNQRHLSINISDGKESEKKEEEKN